MTRDDVPTGMLGPLSRQMGPGYLLGTFRNDEDVDSFETITTRVSENILYLQECFQE